MQVKNSLSESMETEEREERVGEEDARAKARATEAAPSVMGVEDHNLDHSVFRSWRPHCVRGRAEPCGRKMGKDKERGVPIVGLNYTRGAASRRRTAE